VVAERVLEAAERLERDMAARPPPVPAAAPGPAALRLVREDGTVLEVGKERFVVGRGAHCDLVVDSAKISREHAAIVREPDGWWVEDLGSSNGTWFRGERITRRRIVDGDEYFLCAEKIRCELR
jgi:pSer/pThr/pTyr-binding forkhead associated (FHA) protein